MRTSALWPAAGGVAGGLHSAGAPPGSPAGVSGVGFAGLGVPAGAGPPLSRCCGRGRRGVLVGGVPPPLVVPPSPSRRWRGRVLNGVFSGSSLETFSLFYVVLDWAACTLCFGSWIFLLLGDSFFSSRPQMILSPERCCLSGIISSTYTLSSISVWWKLPVLC
uniref:uncharacterized protein LOC143314221 n=1 Tax=Arvicanthis niloticus TaxID=61156 RepID=UPI00402B44D5